MPERQLVHQSQRRAMQDRILAAGLQPTTSAQFVGLLAARRVCTDTSGDERMRKTSTWLLEQGTQTPSPAPDLIPAETRTENSHWDWYSERGHFRSTRFVGSEFVRTTKNGMNRSKQGLWQKRLFQHPRVFQCARISITGYVEHLECWPQLSRMRC